MIALTIVVVPINYLTFKWAVNYVSKPKVEIQTLVPEYDHKRETWISALEWCESNGNNNAINEKDLDGTASYFAFQFKPSTFKHFAIKYGLLPANLEYEDYFNWMSVYEKQREIVRRMIDDPEVKWSQQFPACTKKIGLPPKGG